jgi:ketosteroid isomerase-like protein
MSARNVELARRGYAALNDALQTGDFDDALEQFCDPDIVFVPAGVLPETSEMRGHDGLRRFASNQAEAFEDFSVEPKAFIEAGDKVVVPLRFGGRAAHTGLEVRFDVVHVCTARDGKWVRVEVYATESEALSAVGLPG